MLKNLVEIYKGDEEEINTLNIQNEGLTVILFVGVNGVGKTTTIGKLAYKFKQEGKKVFLQLEIRSGPELLNNWKFGANVSA